MTDPVDYQTPLPQGRNLRCLMLPDGVRISRDVVSRSALWREAIGPPIGISILLAIFVFNLWSVTRHWNDLSFLQKEMCGLIVVGSPFLLFKFVRDARQNSGIITDVAVTQGAFYWRKQTLWGESEHVWPLANIQFARADGMNRILKVYRHRGTPLGAFAFHSMDELSMAAAQLNHAIQMNRMNPSSPPTLPPTRGN